MFILPRCETVSPPRKRRPALEADSAHDGAREEADGEHDPAPDGRGVDHRRAAVEGADDDTRDAVGLAREGRDGKPRRHGRLHEAGADADDADVAVAIGETEPVE